MKLAYEVIYDGSQVDRALSPIIFLHGICEWRKCWKIVGPKIAELTRRKAYAIDARNHGNSPWSKEMNCDVMAEDLKEFMDDRNLDQAVIVGFSMGGRTAICFALKYPKMVDILVIEDMTPSNVISKNKVVDSMARFVKEFLKDIEFDPEDEDVHRTLLETILSVAPDKLANKDKMWEHFDSDFIPIVKTGNKASLLPNVEALVDFVLNDTLVQDLPLRNLKYEGKALFIHGSRPFYKIYKDPNVKKMFPGAVIQELKGATHYIHWEYPKEYINMVVDFIQKCEMPNSKY